MIGCDLIRDLKLFNIPQDYFDELDGKYGIVKIDPDNLPPDKVLNKIQIYFGDRISLDIIENMPNLKWIHLTSIGYDKLLGLKRKDLIVTNSRDTMDNGVLATAIGFMFALSRGLNYCLKSESIDRYEFNQYFDKVQDVIGQSCLIVGMGNIGTKLAKICESLQMRVCGIRQTEYHGVRTLKELPDIVSDYDFVVNLLPYTKQTHGVFDSNIFNRMKETSFFINVGRGKTVVEDDLIEALKYNKIAGAGLDVFESEPLPKNSLLRKLKNTIITPHIGGFSNQYWNRQRKLFSENLKRYLNTEPLLNEVKLC
jgi:phosphoglycerate dehydrogenase-like enzyme